MLCVCTTNRLIEYYLRNDKVSSLAASSMYDFSLHSPHSPPSGTILFFDRTKVGHCHAISHKVHFNVLATQFSHCTCSRVAHVDVGKSTKSENESMLHLRLHDIPGMYTYALWNLRTGCNFTDSCNQDDKIIIPSILAQFQLSLFSLAMLFEWSILKVSI